MTEIRPDFDLFARDELEDATAAAEAASATFSAAVADAAELRQLLDHLIKLRKRADLTQTDVAKIMSVRQPTVSQFETESSDPRLSTLQRYARAIGCRVQICVLDSHGIYSPHVAYRAAIAEGASRPTPISLRSASQASAWEAEYRSKYALAR